MTALLLYQKLIPPADREAWSHEATPELLGTLSNKLLKTDDCKVVASRLKASYELRLVADYIARANVTEAKVKVSLKGVGFIHKLTRRILPQGQL